MIEWTYIFLKRNFSILVFVNILESFRDNNISHMVRVLGVKEWLK